MKQFSESTRKRILICSSLLGIILGALWTVAAVVSILYYVEVLKPFKSDDIFSYPQILFNVFLNKDLNDALDVLDFKVIPSVFNGFMYPYAVLSLILVLISSFIFHRTLHDKISAGFFSISIWVWAGVVLVSSIIDLVLISLLASDLSNFNDLTSNLPLYTDSVLTTTKNSYMIVISIAARGYLFWILNIILAVLMTIIGYNLRKGEKSRNPNHEFIDAYTTSPPISNADLYGEPNGRPINNPYAFTNNAYQSEEIDTPAIEHKIDSYFDFPHHEQQNPYAVPYREEQSNDYKYNNSNSHYEQADNEQQYQSSMYRNGYARPNKSSLYEETKVATIGKRQGQRMAPVQIRPPVPPKGTPYIPPPDYTPPGSPQYERKMKPALKTTSNYMY